MSLPTFKKMDANKHDFPSQKLFAEAADADGMIAAKYDVSSI